MQDSGIMSAQRISVYDYIRVIGVFVIVVCHYLEFSGLNEGLGRYFGLVGNMFFFLLSALLYGKNLETLMGGGNSEYQKICGETNN